MKKKIFSSRKMRKKKMNGTCVDTENNKQQE